MKYVENGMFQFVEVLVCFETKILQWCYKYEEPQKVCVFRKEYGCFPCQYHYVAKSG
jgi:hypothetical protein